MEVETENVLKLLFPNSVPESWKENPDFALYLSKLGSYGVEQLSKEPERLAEEKAAVLEQTQDLVFTNYKTFIHTAECSREIFKEFSNVEKRLGSLVERLPELTRRCQAFSQASSEIATHRRLNSLTLTRNAQLLEILELPQLMDTCVRNGNYEEALELAAYVRRLGKKHGNIPIIESVVRDVETAWVTMLHQLLQQLRCDLPLPRCLQVVGFLRRMQLFSEPELRLKFLQARGAWLQGLLQAIPSADPHHHLSKTIELSRIHLFNIVTQYRAIFSDDEPLLSTSRDNNINESAVFYSWITEKVAHFLHTLEKDLERSQGSSLDSVVGQCMYFGLSFSRVGADFRGLLAPIFVRVVSQNFQASVKKATNKFEQEMESFVLSKSTAAAAAAAVSSRSVTNITEQKPEIPPNSLLEFYVLAEYCNGMLTAFNELRVCAPVAVCQIVTESLKLSLKTVVERTAHWHWQESQADLSNTERDALRRFCSLLALELIPYMQRCLHLVFPVADVALRLAVPAHQLQKEGITYLDQADIIKPLQHILPISSPILGLANLDTVTSDKPTGNNEISDGTVNSSVPIANVQTSSAGMEHEDSISEVATKEISGEASATGSEQKENKASETEKPVTGVNSVNLSIQISNLNLQEVKERKSQSEHSEEK
ncbi:Conserved oligomeric Golgi complex subunit 8 [Gryllus bimaculatus]|nr:Conserved oligomeric Golgi complex subunit 8 [Gryllus bimaculatus]